MLKFGKAVLLLVLACYAGAASARFIQADPIGLEGGPNVYGYANDAPTMYTDPQGLFVPLVIPGVCAAGGCEALLAGAAILMSPTGQKATQSAASQVEKLCKADDKPCDPPEGTQCYEGPDYGKPHAGLSPHYHIYEVQRKRSDGTCFWRYLGGKVGVGVVESPPSGARPCSSYPNFIGRGGR